MSWLSIAAPIVGGLLGASSSGSSRSQSSQMDPRIGRFVYGEDGQSGLLGDARNLYRQQFDQGGLNPMQTGGLEMQRQVLASPQYSQGYDSMRSLGMGLMGGGVAANPFTGGKAVRSNTNMAYSPFSYSTAAVPPSMVNAVTQPIQQPQAPEKPAAETVQDIVDAYLKANKLGKYAEQPYGYDGGGGGGGGYSFGGDQGGWGGGYGFGDGNSGMGD